MEFKANAGVWGTMFGVPCVVADNFLRLATGTQLKTLIYILRNPGVRLSDEDIARSVGASAEEISEAILFWEQANVLSPAPGASVNNIMTPPAEESSPAKAAAPSPEQIERPAVSPRRRENLSPSEIADALAASPDISGMFKAVEARLGALGHTLQNSLIWMNSYLGLKPEVITNLVYCCAELGKTNLAYMEKVACDWAERDVNSLEAADEETKKIFERSDFAGKIVKKFEMIRRPTPKQESFIAQWQREGYSLELIGCAYEKTIEQINKLSFDYINKILESWKRDGISTPKQIEERESDYRKKHVKNDEAANGKYDFAINKF